MRKKIKANHIIFDKIKFRYDFYNINSVWGRGAKDKILIDSFYPAALCQEIASPQGIIKIAQHSAYLDPSPGYCISERVAEDIGARKLHISELVTMLGYTKTDISKLLQQVKNKAYSLTLVGLGGTGSNFLHWIYQMSEWTGKVDIFQFLYAFDDDDYDIPNMLRIPFIPVMDNLDDTSKKTDCIPRKFRSIAVRNTYESRRLTQEDVDGTVRTFSTSARNNMIIYGAPDIRTRAMLAEAPLPFIAATHRDNEFSLVENPQVDDELMMETYGKINLSKFFLNHLTMTIRFLEHLRDRETNTNVTEEREIVRANFDDLYRQQITGAFKAGSKKIIVPHDIITTQIFIPEED